MPETFNPYQAWLGLPSVLLEPNHYELLAIKGFEPDAGTISQAADRAFEKVRNLGPGSQPAAWAQVLARVTAAKACLLDSARKAEYDDRLRAITARPAPAPAYDPQAPLAMPFYSPSTQFAIVPQAMPVRHLHFVPQATFVSPAAYLPQAPAPAAELPRTYLGAQLARKHSQRASYGLLAMAVLFMLLLIGGGVYLLAGILGQGRPLDDVKQRASKGNKVNPSPSTSVGEPEPLADPRPKAKVEPRVEPKTEPRLESKLKPQPASKPELKQDLEPKPQVTQTPQELAALARAFKAARLALGENNLEDADEALVRAASLAKRAEHQAQVRRLKELAHYVREFWRAVDAGRQDLRGGEELEIGDTRIAIVEPGPDKFIYKSQGAVSRCELHEIPGGIAVVLARRKLVANDAATQVILGAIFAASKNADKKIEARRHWEAALAAGTDVKDLLLVLDDTYDFDEEDE